MREVVRQADSDRPKQMCGGSLQDKHEERVRAKTLLAVQWDKPQILDAMLVQEKKTLDMQK